MFFQRKNSKKARDSDGSPQKKEKDSRGKNDFFDRAKGGLGALAGSLKSAKSDAEERAGKVQEDVKARIETILTKGSGIIDKAKENIGGHSEASIPKELGQGGEEQGKEGMEAFNSVLDKLKSHPEVMDKVKEEITSLAGVLHLGKHESKEKEPQAEEKTKEGETTKNGDESASTNKTEDTNVLEQAVEEIQAVVAAVQHQQQTGSAETEVPIETAAATETPAEGEETSREAKPEVEKDDPSKRIGFLGFFAMLFERFCSPGDKKTD